MTESGDDVGIGEKLDEVIALLQRLVALELSRRGVSQEAIGKNIHVAKATVNQMLAGIKKDAAP
jgi:predicted transcriptional regulator